MPDFEVSEYMVTNREMLEFVQDNGYSNDEYWDEEGLKWRDYRNIRYSLNIRKNCLLCALRCLVENYNKNIDRHIVD